MDYTGNALPAPSYRRDGNSTDIEVLYSMVGYRQKGVTLKPGSGVLKTGTILAREDATKLYVPYVSGGSGGAGIPRGVLRKDVNTGTVTKAQDPNVEVFQANILLAGALKLSVMSAAGTSGAIGSALTELKARVDSIFDTFTF